jgi:phosphatidylglycerophosphate synthase
MGFEADERGAKKRDYWFTVIFTDPVAVPISNFLAKRRLLTPNQVTILALIFGLSTGAFFATGERWGLIAGAIAFYLAFVFDCVDGKLARATGITSAKGQALDALADGGRRASASLGLAWFAWNGSGYYFFSSEEGPSIARSGVLIVVVYVVLAYYFLEISGADKSDPAGGGRGKWAEALAKRRLLPNPGMPDVQAIVFIFGPLSGYVVEGLYIGIAMVSVAILLTVRRRLR